MARVAICGVERHMRYAAFVDADRRQNTARADALAEPLMARGVVRYSSWPDDLSNSLSRTRISDRLRFCRSRAVGTNGDGNFRQLLLRPMSVAQLYTELFDAMAELGLDVRITTMPCEIADPIPFDQDHLHVTYDRDYAARFWRVLLSTHEVLAHFRTGFLGKASPVHFFWGSFDLAVTRFSGRPAPHHPGGVPHLPDAVAAEAYSHEVSSAGFWPGGGGPVDYAAFYSYAYPAPQDFAHAPVRPVQAFFSQELGEFILSTTPSAARRTPSAR